MSSAPGEDGDARRAAVSSEIAALAARTEPPLSSALDIAARFVRCDWPEESELDAISRSAQDVAGIQRVQDEMHASSVERLTEAEAARSATTAALERLVSAQAAPPASELDRVISRLGALETYFDNLTIKAGRGAQSEERTRDDIGDLRGRILKLENENAGLKRRLVAAESSLEHVHRILEAASAFAAEGKSAAETTS